MRRRYLPELLAQLGDELFSLILASVPCYEYDMDNHALHSFTLAQRTSPIRRPGVTQNHLLTERTHR